MSTIDGPALSLGCDPVRIHREIRTLATWRRGLCRTAGLVGLATLVLAPGAVRWMAGAGGIAFVALLVARRGGRPPWRPALWRLSAPVAAGAFLVGPLLLGVPWLTDAAFLLVYLLLNQGARVVDARGDRRLLLLALLTGLLSCTLTISPLLAPLFALLALAAPPGLLLCHLGEELEDRATQGGAFLTRTHTRALALLAGLSLLSSGALFLAIPRIQGGFLASMGQPSDLAGFSDRVSLGEIGALEDNPTLVLRARVTGPRGEPREGPFYFRGVALDTFDGRSWSTLAGGRVVLSHRPRFLGLPRIEGFEESIVEQEIQLEPLVRGVLFGIPHVADLTLDEGRVWRDGNGGYHWGGEPRRLAYFVRSVLPDRAAAARLASLPDPARSAPTAMGRIAARQGIYTALPADLDPAVIALAEELTADAETAFDKAVTVERHLRRTYTYTTAPDDPGELPPLRHFLFDSRRGHCEYFATALAVLLRAVDIPTRLVNGFYGGSWNRLGDYLVIRQSDAHSWVEVHLGEAGWVPFDATPPGAVVLDPPGWPVEVADYLSSRWYALILDYDFSSQLTWLVDSGAGVRRHLGLPPLRFRGDAPRRSVEVDALLGLLPLTVLVAILFVSYRLLASRVSGERASRGPRKGDMARILHRARRRVRRRGWILPENLPPLDAARWLRRRAGPSGEPMVELARLYYAVRYGGVAEQPLLPRARRACRALAKLERRKPR